MAGFLRSWTSSHAAGNLATVWPCRGRTPCVFAVDAGGRNTADGIGPTTNHRYCPAAPRVPPSGGTSSRKSLTASPRLRTLPGASSRRDALSHSDTIAVPASISPYRCTLSTFITSSPRWLITFTAILPVLGVSNGRDVSLFRVSHASRLISDFRDVFRRVYGSCAPRK